MMATDRGVDLLSLENNFNNLRVSDSVKLNNSIENGVNWDNESPVKWGFPLKEVYRLALRFYKEKEGKAFHFSYQDKLKLVALTQQVSHGKYNADSLPSLGVLDVIGRDRRLAWQALGDASKEEAMDQFINLLDQQCPLFKPTIDAHKADIEERQRLRKEAEIKKKKEEDRKKIEEEMRIKEEQELIKQEAQRRHIQEALNQQTYTQFKAYAEQQYPGNPEQQAVLVRQLQDQHYHQYMQQLIQQQMCNSNNNKLSESSDGKSLDILSNDRSSPLLIPNGDIPHEEQIESEDEGSSQTISLASMWTRKDIKQFKDTLRNEGGDAIIRVGHGETVTVRVPTHQDGTCLFWEFATDNYDIGFGVYFEWTKSPTNQVSVHVSESEDDDDDIDEDDYDDDEEFHDDVEKATIAANRKLDSNRPPLSIIVPVYRRDCQNEVYAGSHTYPGEGVYLLKFDNSYSLWRSKTLYYRVYYTR